MAVAIALFFVVGAFLNGVSCHPDGIVPEGFFTRVKPRGYNRGRHTNAGNVGIIGGHHILIEKAPFMASLRLNGTFHWCGASIIHEQFVLTAAHCIVPNRVYKVLVGTDNVKGDGELFEIEKINIHESFNNRTYEYDFCLIKLNKSLTFGPKIAKINLATADLKLPKGTELNVTGWGSTGTNVVSPKLLQVEIPLIGRRKCKVLYALHKYAITPRMICAGNRGHDSCQGDSGGPLTLGNVQVGVTSFGLGCGIMPGVYARVSSVINWITTKINLVQ